jgi:hypothetical protein
MGRINFIVENRRQIEIFLMIRPELATLDVQTPLNGKPNYGMEKLKQLVRHDLNTGYGWYMAKNCRMQGK